MTSWLDVTEESVNGFLLILKPSNRECVRKDLYQFFVLLKCKRLLFTIPMTNYKVRKLAMTTYVMNYREQSRLAKKLLTEGIMMPYEAIVTSLIFYHAVQTRMISTIKLSDIDVDSQRISMNETPDIYLMPIEMKILKEYLLNREEFPNSAGRKWLFIQRKRGAYGISHTQDGRYGKYEEFLLEESLNAMEEA